MWQSFGLRMFDVILKFSQSFVSFVNLSLILHSAFHAVPCLNRCCQTLPCWLNLLVGWSSWNSTSDKPHPTLLFVCLYPLVHHHVAKSLAERQVAHEQFVIKQLTLCALTRSWGSERDTKVSVPLLTHFHTRREKVELPLPPTCSALASLRMLLWLRQHCGTLRVTTRKRVLIVASHVVFYCLFWGEVAFK